MRLRPGARVIGPALLATVGGAVLAGLTRLADAPVAAWLGWELAVAPSQALFAALVGGVITVAVFSLWMRTVMVGLMSSQFSARVLSGFLDDRFQRRLTVAMSGAVAFDAAALVAIPEGTSAPPLVTVTVGVVIAVLVLVSVLVAMHDAVESISVGGLVRHLTDRAVEMLPDLDTDDGALARSPPSFSPRAHVLAESLGWVHHIDTDALLEATPAGGRIRVTVRVGEFVRPGRPIADLDEVAVDGDEGAVRAAVVLSEQRELEDDLSYALQQLSDAVQRGMSPSGADSSTAHQGLVHLTAVMVAMLDRGAPRTYATRDDGTWVGSAAEADEAEHVHLVFERICRTASHDPVYAKEVLRALCDLRAAADRADNGSVAATIDAEVERLLVDVSERGGTSRDRQELQSLASELGALPARTSIEDPLG